MTNHSNININENELDLIVTFEQNLEKIFFAETQVIIGPSDENHINIIIEISPFFTLPETISLFRMPINISKQWQNLNRVLIDFKKEVKKINQLTISRIHVEELSIYFKDTSITITSVDPNSILDEIVFITYSILQHYDSYATIMGMIPSAIHIPVIEDPTTKEIFGKNAMKLTQAYESPYSKFWGLYYNSLSKPVIYNLKRSNIIPGDLDLDV